MSSLRHPAAALLACVFLALAGCGYGSRQAAVAMPDSFSAEAAASALREGGNAVDAAVAAAFVLAVTLAEAGNIGGGGFMVSRMRGEAAFLDFRETAPSAAHRDMYLDANGEVREGLSYTGALSVGVPGTVRGLALAHERYGALAWPRLLAPAIALAEDGFAVPAALADKAAASARRFAGRTNFAEHFGALEAGERFSQPELAATLRRLAEAPEDFYQGETAELLLAQMRRDGGIVSREDLASYRPVWREPLRFDWRGYRLLAPAPPSSGGVALAQLLGMREAAAERFAGVAHNSARYLHLLAEIEKRVFADRGEYLGDPDFRSVPLERLIDPDYIASRAAALDPDAQSAAASVQPGLEGADTTHFSIVDGDGNAVALTYTLNWGFGSGVVVEGAGFLLNDEMDDFSAKPGAPNQFGVVGAERNAIAPGKRMLSSMTPTILSDDEGVVAVLGSPGGSTIFTSVFQTLLNVFEFEMDAQAAVDAGRFHHQLPQADLIRHDRGREAPEALAERLAGYGYRVEPNRWGDLGNVQLVLRERGLFGNRLRAASDVRGRGRSLVIRLP